MSMKPRTRAVWIEVCMTIMVLYETGHKGVNVSYGHDKKIYCRGFVD